MPVTINNYYSMRYTSVRTRVRIGPRVRVLTLRRHFVLLPHVNGTQATTGLLDGETVHLVARKSLSGRTYIRISRRGKSLPTERDDLIGFKLVDGRRRQEAPVRLIRPSRSWRGSGAGRRPCP